VRVRVRAHARVRARERALCARVCGAYTCACACACACACSGRASGRASDRAIERATKSLCKRKGAWEKGCLSVSVCLPFYLRVFVCVKEKSCMCLCVYVCVRDRVCMFVCVRVCDACVIVIMFVCVYTRVVPSPNKCQQIRAQNLYIPGKKKGVCVYVSVWVRVRP